MGRDEYLIYKICIPAARSFTARQAKLVRCAQS